MQKVLFSFFVAVGYVLRSLKHPATWAVIALVGGLWWWRSHSREAAKVVHQVAPIEFKPLVVEPDAAAAPGSSPAKPGITAAPAEESDTLDPDPGKRPVMSARDLEVAAGRLHKDNLRLPKDADELIAQKYLVGVPPAPPGKRYVLDLAPIQMRLVSK
ncbi:MAG: hypothetical protein ACKODH_14880 [Limisphaerales bacterium]